MEGLERAPYKQVSVYAALALLDQIRATATGESGGGDGARAPMPTVGSWAKLDAEPEPEKLTPALEVAGVAAGGAAPQRRRRRAAAITRTAPAA